jgi:hypothetical protein
MAQHIQPTLVCDPYHTPGLFVSVTVLIVDTAESLEAGSRSSLHRPSYPSHPAIAHRRPLDQSTPATRPFLAPGQRGRNGLPRQCRFWVATHTPAQRSRYAIVAVPKKIGKKVKPDLGGVKREEVRGL